MAAASSGAVRAPTPSKSPGGGGGRTKKRSRGGLWEQNVCRQSPENPGSARLTAKSVSGGPFLRVCLEYKSLASSWGFMREAVSFAAAPGLRSCRARVHTQHAKR